MCAATERSGGGRGVGNVAGRGRHRRYFIDRTPGSCPRVAGRGWSARMRSCPRRVGVSWGKTVATWGPDRVNCDETGQSGGKTGVALTRAPGPHPSRSSAAACRPPGRPRAPPRRPLRAQSASGMSLYTIEAGAPFRHRGAPLLATCAPCRRCSPSSSTRRNVWASTRAGARRSRTSPISCALAPTEIEIGVSYLAGRHAAGSKRHRLRADPRCASGAQCRESSSR